MDQNQTQTTQPVVTEQPVTIATAEVAPKTYTKKQVIGAGLGGVGLGAALTAVGIALWSNHTYNRDQKLLLQNQQPTYVQVAPQPQPVQAPVQQVAEQPVTTEEA